MDRGAGTEAVEAEHPHDRPPPPPPPETPGSDLPSRAETHKAAAELDAEDDRQPAEDKPGISQQPPEVTAEEQDSKPTDDATDSPAPPEPADSSGKALAGERDTPEEQATTGETDTIQGGREQELPSTTASETARTESYDPSPEQQPSESGTSPTEDTVIDNRPATTDSVAEPADTRPATELGGPSDMPVAEPDEMLAGIDNRSAAAEADTDVTGQPDTETAEAAPKQPESAGSISDTVAVADITDGPTDRVNEAQQQVDDMVEIDTPTKIADDSPQSPDAAEPDTGRHLSDEAAPTPEIGRPEGHDSAEVRDGSSDKTTEAGEGEERPGFELMVGDETVREHIDPAGAASERPHPQGQKEPFVRQIREEDSVWTDGVDRFDELPTGEKLLEDSDKASRAERARREAFRQSDQAADAVKKHVVIGRGAFEKPPAGRPEVKVCPLVPSPLEYLPAHEGVSVENMVSNLLVLGILASAGARRLVRAGREKER